MARTASHLASQEFSLNSNHYSTGLLNAMLHFHSFCSVKVQHCPLQTDHLLRLLTSSVNGGRIASTSPITPKSAREKIGECSSLLIATMYLEPFIPETC